MVEVSLTWLGCGLESRFVGVVRERKVLLVLWWGRIVIGFHFGEVVAGEGMEVVARSPEESQRGGRTVSLPMLSKPTHRSA